MTISGAEAQVMHLTNGDFRHVLSRAEHLRASPRPLPLFAAYLRRKFGPLVQTQIQTIWAMTTCASTMPLPRSQPDRPEMIWLMKRNLRSQVCPLCQSTLDSGFHVDHMIPVKLGGFSSGKNLQPLCSSCNLKKGKKLLEVEQYAKIWNII